MSDAGDGLLKPPDVKEKPAEATEEQGPSHEAPPVIDFLDRTRYPVDPWPLVEQHFSDEDLGNTETLFALGNGYLGMRGNVEEGRDSHSHGTFINGFHETWPIQHAEEAYGFARVGQTIVNAPDAKVIRLYVDDEPLLLPVADLLEYERSIDFRTGVHSRDVLWRTPAGKRVRSAHHPDGVAHPAAPRGHDVRGHAARRRRAGGDLLADPQPPGRRGRVPRPRQGHG